MSDIDDVKEQLRTSDRPLIMLDHNRAFCAMHMEPYRAESPKGYPTATVMLAKAVLESVATAAAIRELKGLAPDAPLNLADREFERSVEALLDAKPACCRVSTGVLREIYLTSIAKPGRCRVCRRKGPGTPYRLASGDSWVCVDCVLHNLYPGKQ